MAQIADVIKELTREANEKAEKKHKKKISIIVSIAAVFIIFLIVLTKVIILNSEYSAALELYNAGNCEEAMVELKKLNGYRDSNKLIVQHEMENIKSAEVGDYIEFGLYEQNNDFISKDNIEWLVLAKEDNRLLVISKYALDCQQYNDSFNTDLTWETCSLRTWMNIAFLNEAFSKEEQAIIESTKASADKNPDYSTNPGSATTDKVFLLSINEAEKYFISDDSRMCVPTEYAVSKGAYSSNSYIALGKDTCWWWLRSPGGSQSNAAIVNADGSVYSSGCDVGYADFFVRPALWINLNS